MQYLVFHPPSDRDIAILINHWLEEAGGKLSMEEVENKMRKQFKCEPFSTILDETRARQFHLLEYAYKLENGMVSHL